MSVQRFGVLLAVLLSLAMGLSAFAEGAKIKANPQAAVYSVELPGEKVKELVCTGDIRLRTATCAEQETTVCKISQVKFREGLTGTEQSCKVSDCTPKRNAAAAGKCECKVKISDCR